MISLNRSLVNEDSFKNHLETKAHLKRKEGAKSHLVIQRIKENKNDDRALVPNKHIKEEHQTLFGKQLLKNNSLENYILWVRANTNRYLTSVKFWRSKNRHKCNM